MPQPPSQILELLKANNFTITPETQALIYKHVITELLIKNSFTITPAIQTAINEHPHLKSCLDALNRLTATIRSGAFFKNETFLRLSTVKDNILSIISLENPQPVVDFIIALYNNPTENQSAINIIAEHFLKNHIKSLDSNANMRNISQSALILFENSIFSLENTSVIIKHPDPCSYADALVAFHKKHYQISESMKEKLITHKNPRLYAEALVECLSADFEISSTLDTVLFSSGQPHLLVEALVKLQNNSFQTLEENIRILRDSSEPNICADILITLQNLGLTLSEENIRTITKEAQKTISYLKKLQENNLFINKKIKDSLCAIITSPLVAHVVDILILFQNNNPDLITPKNIKKMVSTTPEQTAMTWIRITSALRIFNEIASKNPSDHEITLTQEIFDAIIDITDYDKLKIIAQALIGHYLPPCQIMVMEMIRHSNPQSVYNALKKLKDATRLPWNFATNLRQLGIDYPMDMMRQKDPENVADVIIMLVNIGVDFKRPDPDTIAFLQNLLPKPGHVAEAKP